MGRIAIVGCGIVGAAIAYELSGIEGLQVTLLDRQTPGSGSTKAALGVLMGAMSQKKSGRGWQLRQTSLERYETLIPELERLTGQSIPYNRHGIVRLGFAEKEIQKWQKLVEVRRSQGWELEIWERSRLQEFCPQIESDRTLAALYSPRDCQVDPTALTQALVAGAKLKGADCRFGVEVETCLSDPSGNICDRLQTTAGTLECDWLIIAAGLGSTPLTTSLAQPVDLRPVLGQALQLQLPQPLGNRDFQPVITGDDLNIVPLGKGSYWVGATVEFADSKGEVVADANLLQGLRERAIALCPALAAATIVRTWSGKRPRPEGRPAPIIEFLPGYRNVVVATGHYRNGILLAPATARIVREWIVEGLESDRRSNDSWSGYGKSR